MKGKEFTIGLIVASCILLSLCADPLCAATYSPSEILPAQADHHYQTSNLFKIDIDNEKEVPFFSGGLWIFSYEPIGEDPVEQAIPVGVSSETITKELPALPDSASLFLYALGSLGAWQITRSAKLYNFAMAPEWYHSGGPRQIGYAFAFDLDYHNIPVSFFAQKVEEKPCCLSISRTEWFTVRAQRYCLIKLEPRAPPGASLG